MVHTHDTHDAIDAVRRTVSRAARPALAPLRAAAATLHAQGTVTPSSDDDRHASARPSGRVEPGAGDLEHLGELEELAAMRDELAAAPDLRLPDPTDRAARATRSASAYLEARRARLRRELRAIETGR